MTAHAERPDSGRRPGLRAALLPSSPSHRDPLGIYLMVLLAAVGAGLLALFLVGGIQYAYQRIGISEHAMFALLFGSLAGSAINIPIARLPARKQDREREVVLLGVRYRVPVPWKPERTTLAVNVGGALIPAGVSAYLLVKDGIWWQAAVGVTFVAVIVHLIARPVKGVGITVPGIIPPLLAAGIAVIVAPHMAAPVAYVSGSLGTLIGADLTNIKQLSSLGGGMASIGGAGTFDGVFLSGIVGVLLVSVR